MTNASRFASVFLCLWMALLCRGRAQTTEPFCYDIGSPVLSNIWVDAVSGNDGNSGNSSNEALLTITAAWGRIPSSTLLTGRGFRIWLNPGVHSNGVPSYWQQRYGTSSCPVIVQAAGPVGSVRMPDMNIYDCRYLYLVGLRIDWMEYGSDGIHLEQCRNVLIRDCQVNGNNPTNHAAQEAIKANQCKYVYVELTEAWGAYDNALDFVGVQYGHIVRSRFHDAAEWGAYLKGGSAQFRVEACEFYDARTGGFAAGQGTTFDYMVSPWLHYEAYDIKFINNVIHHTGTVGLGVHGGYNILMAYNTLYKAGTNDHAIEVTHGSRQGVSAAICTNYNAAGGWGTVGPDTECIPNRNVSICNNIVYNPAGFRSQYQHFTIGGDVVPPVGWNIPNPSRADTNLWIEGNLIWNGPPDMTNLSILGGSAGAQPGNPTCNEALIVARNRINQVEPRLVNPEAGDFRPVITGGVFGANAVAIAAFAGGDRPTPPLAPAGNLTNVVSRGREGYTRYRLVPPGASTGGSSIEMSGITRTDTVARVILCGETGYSYRVEVSTNLPGGWGLLVVTNLPVVSNVVGDAAVRSRAFYRARLLP